MAEDQSYSAAEKQNQTTGKIYLVLAVGHPGCGKTTFCRAAKQFHAAIGRKSAIINLDPGNYRSKSDKDTALNPDIDILDLVNIESLMADHRIGPNNALIQAMRNLELNTQWLIEKLDGYPQDTFFFVDFPGQVEILSHERVLQQILAKIKRGCRNEARCVALNLADCHNCSNGHNFIALLLLTLSTMINLELPQINVLSKLDMLSANDVQNNHRLEFYTEVRSAKFLAENEQETKFSKKYQKLTTEIAEIIDAYDLVNFTTLDVNSKHMMANLMHNIDKTVGYSDSTKDTIDLSEFKNINVEFPER